jgi:hypothetical protein
MLAHGCAFLTPPTPDAGPTSAAPPGGRIEVRTGRPGLVIAAPHGTSDASTDAIARELARLTGFGLVVATGFSGLDTGSRRLNVNRPTESAPGTPARLEERTDAAREAYARYRRSVDEAAQGRVQLYVEVHGNGHRDTADRIEIATVGLTRDDAWRIRTLLELVRDAHVDGAEDVPRLEVRVESVDPLRYTAAASKRSGVLGASDRALHIELPRAARIAHRDAYTVVLAEFLLQSLAVLVPPLR